METRYTKLTGFEKVPVHVSFIEVLNYVEPVGKKGKEGEDTGRARGRSNNDARILTLATAILA